MATEFTPPAPANRVSSYYPSKVRELFAHANRPNMISFAGGMPNLTGLDLDRIAELSARIIRDYGTMALQYSEGRGLAQLRARIAEIEAIEGPQVDPDHLIVTPGSQFGLSVVAGNLLNPGDVVIAESPSYAGGVAALRAYEADVRQVGTDGQGLIPEAVDEELSRAAAEGLRCPLVYTIPTFQNPGGTLMPPERRHALAEICARHGTWIIEDNPYGLLGFDGQPHRAIKADYPDQVIYLGSFSKTVGPGLRIGWIDAPESIDGILAGSAETVLNPSTLNQMLLHDYLEGDAWLEALAAARDIYANKAAAMIAGLEQHFPPGATWTTPEGGFYVWVTVPESLDAADLVFDAIDQGVIYIPGNAFYGDGRGRHEMRLSFSLPSIDDISRGVEIIGRVLSQ